MAIPPVSYLEDFEAGRYQEAALNEELERAHKEGDPVAGALLVLAEGYLHEVRNQSQEAVDAFRDVVRLLEGQDSWKANALRQQAQQAVEYMQGGKPLPDLPGGL